MSKRINLEINCPHCHQQYNGTFFRTLWGEYEENRKMVMEDNVNIAVCPHCGFSFHVPLAMMYVDVRENFAVWWEPYYDSGIDSDSAGYAKMFGAKSYYATAPRIADWEEFKSTIQKYYRKELIGGPVEKMDFSALRAGSNKKNQGCLGLLLTMLGISSLLCFAGILFL